MSGCRGAQEVEFENARLAHAAVNKSMETETAMVATFGNAAMRAPALAAAGGIAAILGFFSANAGILRGTIAVDDFNSALLWFFASIFGCVLAPGFAYFSQGFFVWSKGAQSHHFERPFVRNTLRSRCFFCIGVVFQIGAICLTILSIIALVIGGIAFLEVADFIADAQPPHVSFDRGLWANERSACLSMTG